MAGFLRSSQPLAASTPPNHSRRIRTPQPHGVAPKTSPEPRPLLHSGSASLSVFCNGDIGAIDPNCNDDAAADVGAAKSPSAAPKFEANVELGMLHADRNPKAMRQNRCSNLSAVIASPYEMRADHEGRRRALFLSGSLFLLFQKLCAILARLFDKREVDDAGADPSNRASASGRPLQPIENTQNQRENLWGNLEKFANSLQLSSLGFNKIKGLTRPKPRLRFDSELFFGPFWRCQRPAQRAGCSLSGGIRLQRWIASPFGGRNDGRRWVQMIHLFRRVA